MDILLSVINIVLIIVLAWMQVLVILHPRSRAQFSFFLFDTFVLVFVFGLELELLHSDSVEAALSGLAVQYLGQCGFFIGLLWFANDFIDMRVPHGVFALQGIISFFTMGGILTAGMNPWFYTSMRIETDGMYNRIECTHGVLWYLHYGYVVAVMVYIIAACFVKYRSMEPAQKKRAAYFMTGLGVFFAELMLKGLGVFGSYNPVGIALTATVICFALAVLREDYFDSIDATMENVLNHGDEGLVVLDSWSRVIFLNKKAEKLFPDTEKGYPVYSQKSLSDAMNKADRRVDIDGEIWEERPEDIIENNVKTGVMVYFVNVTELVHQSEWLKTVNDERSRFMTRASHELRSPLNVVLGADEMILRETKENETVRYATLIKEEVGSMVSLVEDIVNASLAEQQKLILKEDTFSLKSLLAHLNSVYKEKAVKQGLGFRFLWDGVDPETHPEVLLYGDRNRLMQILRNLLENAVKYTEKGEIKLSAAVKEQNAGEVLMEFIVSDTGTGIPESEQKGIFEKYRRGKQAKETGKDGLGLGLSIVKGFLDAMGGTIRLQSRPGQGSVFTLDIPFKEVSATGPEAAQNRAERMEVPGNLSFAGKRILAVDDRSRNILLLQHLMKESGLSIDAANNGPDAVEMSRNTDYDALIIDYMMPGMDGAETLHAIRNDPDGKNKDTYAIAFSANVTPDAEKMYRQEGFSDFLPKPAYYEDIVRVLSKAFEGDRLFLRLRAIGVDTDAGISYSDDEADFYIELLKSFAKSAGQDIQGLRSAYEDIRSGADETADGLDPLKEFTRIAHSVKGELRGFGDENGAELFYSLEKAGKAGDIHTIEETLSRAISHLEGFTSAVNGS